MSGPHATQSAFLIAVLRLSGCFVSNDIQSRNNDKHLMAASNTNKTAVNHSNNDSQGSASHKQSPLNFRQLLISVDSAENLIAYLGSETETGTQNPSLDCPPKSGYAPLSDVVLSVDLKGQVVVDKRS